MTDNLDVTEKVCPRCGGKEVKSYCPDCGYHWHEGEYTVKALIQEWVYKGVSDIRLFLITTRDLFLRPEKVISPYFNHTHSAYYQPVSYLFLVISMFAVGTYLFQKPDPEKALQAQMELYKQMGMEYSPESRNFQLEYLNWVQQHIDWLYLMGVPFVAITFWLMFRKRGLNFGQLLIFSCYTYGFYYLLLLPRAMVHDPLSMDYLEIIISFGVWAIVFSWFFYRVFQKKAWSAIGLGIWSYILYSIVFLTAIMVAVVVGVVGIVVVVQTTGWNPFKG